MPENFSMPAGPLSVLLVLLTVIILTAAGLYLAKRFRREQQQLRSEWLALLRFARENKFDIPEINLLRFYYEHFPLSLASAMKGHEPDKDDLKKRLLDFFNQHPDLPLLTEVHMLEKIFHKKALPLKSPRSLHQDEPVALQGHHTRTIAVVVSAGRRHIELSVPGPAGQIDSGDGFLLTAFRPGFGEFTLTGSLELVAAGRLLFTPAGGFKRQVQGGNQREVHLALTARADGKTSADVPGRAVRLSDGVVDVRLQLEDALSTTGVLFELTFEGNEGKNLSVNGSLTPYTNMPGYFAFIAAEKDRHLLENLDKL